MAAKAQSLPFKGNSFDTIVSLFAVPLEVGPDFYGQTYEDIYRVLKPGGAAYLTPLNKTVIEISKPFLENVGIPYSLRTVETPSGPMEDWKRLTIMKV